MLKMQSCKIIVFGKFWICIILQLNLQSLRGLGNETNFFLPSHLKRILEIWQSRMVGGLQFFSFRKDSCIFDFKS